MASRDSCPVNRPTPSSSLLVTGADRVPASRYIRQFRRRYGPVLPQLGTWYSGVRLRSVPLGAYPGADRRYTSPTVQPRSCPRYQDKVCPQPGTGEDQERLSGRSTVRLLVALPYQANEVSAFLPFVVGGAHKFRYEVNAEAADPSFFDTTRGIRFRASAKGLNLGPKSVSSISTASALKETRHSTSFPPPLSPWWMIFISSSSIASLIWKSSAGGHSSDSPTSVELRVNPLKAINARLKLEGEPVLHGRFP